MKITDSSIAMDAQWASVSRKTVTESMRMWDDRTNLSQQFDKGFIVDISEQGRELQRNAVVAQPQEATHDERFQLTDRDKEKIKLLEDFIHILTGKRLKLRVVNDITKDQADQFNGVRRLPEAQPIRLVNSPVVQGWGLNYQYHEHVEEHERMAFFSSGTVETADGRRIQFNLDFKVSRDFVSDTSISVKAGDALLDPLIINFKNASAKLGDRNYSFDLDMDGTKDKIAFTAQGSGFLALDKNGNGSIDDGSELFGPQSGNGFSELSKLDSDGNNWIDENDPIFEKLRIWTMDEAGNTQLVALGQAGVGAIYLGNVTTPYSLKDQGNTTDGQIAKTGIFLREDGSAGTIQHVDLAI